MIVPILSLEFLCLWMILETQQRNMHLLPVWYFDPQFLQDLLDSLFSILMQNTISDVYDNLVFDALVSIKSSSQFNWSIDLIVFYAVSAVFQPKNNGSQFNCDTASWIIVKHKWLMLADYLQVLYSLKSVLCIQFNLIWHWYCCSFTWNFFF